MNDKKIRAALEQFNADQSDENARNIISSEIGSYVVIVRQPDGKVDIEETIDALSFALATGQSVIADCMSVAELLATKAPTFEANPVTGEALRKGKTTTKPVVDFSGVSLSLRRVIGYARLTGQLPHVGASCQTEMVVADLVKPQLDAPWPRLVGELKSLDEAAKGGDKKARALSEAVDETIVFRGISVTATKRHTSVPAPAQAPAPRVPVQVAEAANRRVMRQVIKDVYRTDSDQDAFFGDYFPEIKEKFSSGMDRDAKINIGFELASADAIVRAVQEDKPHAFAASYAKFSPPAGLDLFIFAQVRDRSKAKELLDQCFAIKSRQWTLGCPAGTQYDAWLRAQLREAKVVVAVLSADLLCDSENMTLLEEAARSGKRVLPYIARTCTWGESFLGKARPLSEESHIAASEIRNAIAAVG